MPIDFDALCEQLATDGPLSVHPSEIHGLGCGLLAAGFRPDAHGLFQQIREYTGDELPKNEKIMPLFHESLKTLQGESFEFQLCLPDDDVYALPERAESLRSWCLGFLHGFAAVKNPLTAEAQELLQDLTEISQLDAASLDCVGLSENDEDENEGYYAELTEFVRMAVVSLFMDNNDLENEQAKKAGAIHH